MRKGCRYRTGSPEMCTFNIMHGKVDPECELVGEDRCYLKGQSPQRLAVTGVKSERRDDLTSVQSSTPLGAKSEKRYRAGLWQRTPKDQSVAFQENINRNYISGPFHLHIFKDSDDNYYYLFSDKHYSLKGACPIQGCQQLTRQPNGTITTVGNAQNCKYISKLLRDIFQTANTRGDGVDFYLEYPFVTDATGQSKDIHVTEMAQQHFLYQIVDVFKECFQQTKGKCPYQNVRFHYVDVRQVHTNSGESEFTTLDKFLYLKNFMNIIMYFLQVVAPEGPDSDNLKLLDSKEDKQTIDLIEQYNTTFWNMYNNNGNSAKLFFKYFLESDQFDTDFTNLYNNVVPNDLRVKPLFTDFVNSMMSLTTKRDGKVMHRARAQLYELSKTDKDLSDRILNYVWTNFNKDFDPITILNAWGKFYSVYQSFIRKPQTGLFGFSKMKDEYRQKLKNLAAFYQNFQADPESSNIKVVASNANLMDAYFLARLFRKYQTPRHQRQEGIKSKIKIVYAGGKHILDYVAFLETLPDFKLLYSSQNLQGNERCIDVPFKTANDYFNPEQAIGQNEQRMEPMNLFFNPEHE